MGDAALVLLCLRSLEDGDHLLSFCFAIGGHHERVIRVRQTCRPGSKYLERHKAVHTAVVKVGLPRPRLYSVRSPLAFCCH